MVVGVDDKGGEASTLMSVVTETLTVVFCSFKVVRSLFLNAIDLRACLASFCKRLRCRRVLTSHCKDVSEKESSTF